MSDTLPQQWRLSGQSAELAQPWRCSHPACSVGSKGGAGRRVPLYQAPSTEGAFVMKHRIWMVGLCLLSAGLGAAGGVFAAKNKEIVVTPDSEVKFQSFDPTDKEGKGPQISVVFGDLSKKGPIGYLLKVPAGEISPAHTHTSDDYAVVIKGAMSNYAPGTEDKALAAGGTWFQPRGVAHINHCQAGAPCEVFVYMANGFDFAPAKAEAPKQEAPKK
jgi:quercetin dioxygenase-like cupin family protein